MDYNNSHSRNRIKTHGVVELCCLDGSSMVQSFHLLFCQFYFGEIIYYFFNELHSSFKYLPNYGKSDAGSG